MYQTTYIYLLLAGNLRQVSLRALSFQTLKHICLKTGEL